MTRLAFVALLIATPVRAQTTDADRLLRTTWSECGSDCSAEEMAALHAVIRGRSERLGVSYRAAWEALQRGVATETVTRSWLSGLHTECNEPRNWPRFTIDRHTGEVRPHPPWSVYRDDCEILVVQVRWVQSGYVPNPCGILPVSWGDRHDIRRRERRSAETSWHEAACGSDLRLHFGEWR